MEVFAVYTGRFHPFHRGHASSFNQLADQFGLEHTLLAISGKQEQPKSPFSVGDRAKMAMAVGVPKENIISVTQPYKAEEYIKYLESKGLDPQDFSLVFGVSKKDMEGVPEMGIPPDPRFTFKPKRDGSPSYLQPYSGNENNLKNMLQHAYVYSTDVEEFPIAGETMRDASTIRAAYKTGDQHKRNKILHDMYGKHAKHIKPIFDRELLQDAPGLKEFYQRIKPLLKEASIPKRVEMLKRLLEKRRRKGKHRGFKSGRSITTGWWGGLGNDSGAGGDGGGVEESLNEFRVERGDGDDDGDDRGPGLTRQEFKNALKLALGYDMTGVDVSTFEGNMLRVKVNGERRIVPCNRLGVKDAAAFVKRIRKQDVAEASSPAQQAAIAVNMKKAGKKPKKVNEAAKRINRFKLVDLLEQSIKVLPTATLSQRKKLHSFITEARNILQNSSNNESSIIAHHDIVILENELRSKGVCFWPSTTDDRADRYVAEHYTKITSHNRQLDKILRMHFNDTALSEHQYRKIRRVICARNALRELNYSGAQKTVIDENIDYHNSQLQQILSQFDKFKTGNQVNVGDDICVLRLEVLKYTGRGQGNVTLTGFTEPKKIVDMDDFRIEFSDGSYWPNIQDHKNIKTASQTILFKNVKNADTCATHMHNFISSENSNDDYEFKIYVDRDEPMNFNLPESVSPQEIIDYLEESVTPQSEFPNKEMLAKQPGNIIWWGQTVVGITTGALTDRGAEFTMKDGKYGYLPLPVVSIRQK